MPFEGGSEVSRSESLGRFVLGAVSAFANLYRNSHSTGAPAAVKLLVVTRDLLWRSSQAQVSRARHRFPEGQLKAIYDGNRGYQGNPIT